MPEKISIEGFLGLESIKIDIKRITIIIGPQASGKSVTAKLIHYFKTIPDDLQNVVLNEGTKYHLNNKLLERFKEYFPPETWQSSEFSISYTNNNLSISIQKTKNQKNPKIVLDEQLGRLFNKCRTAYKRYLEKSNLDEESSYDEFINHNPRYRIRTFFYEHVTELSDNLGFQQIYIPAGRSFFANLQSSIFTFLSTNNAIDPFLKSFGMFYENIKKYRRDLSPRRRRFEKIRNKTDFISKKVLSGDHILEKGEDFLVLNDGRKLKLENCSSGQQEALPLTLILKALTEINFIGKGSTCYIEEPEAHLFPFAQRDIVNLISLSFNRSVVPSQFILTTHSPYILTAFNNNIHAGELERSLPQEKHQFLYDLVEKDLILDPKIISANSIMEGKSSSLFCDETHLITSDIIDQVSNDLAIQFGNLLDLESE